MLLASDQLTASLYVAIPLIGLLAGVLGGALGIGGGLVMIPAMLLVLGEERLGVGSLHSYKLAALAAATVLSMFAAREHARRGAVIGALVRAIIPGALLGVVAGTVLGALFADEHTKLLRRLFGAFMLLVVASYIWRTWLAAPPDSVSMHSCPAPRRRGLYALLVGLPSGIIAGLLGVGGGVWAVPVQHYACGVRLQNAIANSSCMIVAVAAAASVTQSIAVHRMEGLHLLDAWVLAGLLAPGAFIGGRIGAVLTHRLPVVWLRHAFHILLAVTGFKLLEPIKLLFG